MKESMTQYKSSFQEISKEVKGVSQDISRFTQNSNQGKIYVETVKSLTKINKQSAFAVYQG
jgi:hypothetical protein